MKILTFTLAMVSFLTLSVAAGDKLDALDEQFIRGLDELKREYRAGLAELLVNASRIELYQVDEPKKKKESDGAIDPFITREAYWELGSFEYKINEEREITGKELTHWTEALSSLLVPKEPEYWTARHHTDTVLIVYGRNIDPLFEESMIFEVILSWEYNNYLIRYPFLDLDRHAIPGLELKKLIMTEFPNGSYQISSTLKEIINEPNQSGSESHH